MNMVVSSTCILIDQNYTVHRLSVDSVFSSSGQEHLTSYQVAYSHCPKPCWYEVGGYGYIQL